MNTEPCVMCGVAVPFKKRSGKRLCYECHKVKAREYAHNKYLKDIESGKIHEYRRKAAEYMIKKYRSDPVYRLFTRAKNRSAADGIEFNITTDDIIIPDMCPVLKTPFVYNTYYTASIDRIDSSKGYVKGNIQVMSHKANAMKNSATNAELVAFAKWVNENVPEG